MGKVGGAIAGTLNVSIMTPAALANIPEPPIISDEQSNVNAL